MNTILSQRQLFSIPDDIAYFNCAYNSPLLNESVKRLQRGVAAKSHPWERTADDFFNDAESIRVLSAAIFKGDSDGFAVVPSTSYGISTAARALEPTLQCNDKILLIEEAFPSNYYPWARTAHETDSKIITVSTPTSGDWTTAILNKLETGVKVVALPNCHWTNGAYIDLIAIGAACRSLGSAFIVDATQSLGAMPFIIDEIKPDFMVASGYKWLLCPYGFSLLYVSEQWRTSRPLEETWIARDNARDFSSLVNYSDNYMPGARRFEAGEKCAPTILPGAIAALEQIKAWKVDQIASALSGITTRISSFMESLGFVLPPSPLRSPHMFGAKLPEWYKGNLVAELRKRGVYVSQRGNSVRFSPHVFISETDMQRLFESLKQIFA